VREYVHARMVLTGHEGVHAVPVGARPVCALPKPATHFASRARGSAGRSPAARSSMLLGLVVPGLIRRSIFPPPHM
jgi:hypothetical protein